MFVKLRCIVEPEEIRVGVSECTYLAFCVQVSLMTFISLMSVSRVEGGGGH